MHNCLYKTCKVMKSGWDGKQYIYKFSCGHIIYSSDGKIAPIVIK